jgi:predicted short-subunit dehydrogenase-like oxidoreductase (DUF2520 family)
MLADELGCAHGSLEETDLTALVYLVAISDSALYEIGNWLHLEKALVLHTAGSVSKHLLARVSHNYGVIWPLQSLRKESREIPDMPLVIDANTPECLTLVRDLAESLGGEVKVMDDEERTKMHLAAVMSGNFANHLFAMVNRYCFVEGLDFKLLLPMLHETVERMKENDPASMQTGPAARNDIETMNRHMEMLDGDEDLREVYDMFSSLIVSR